MLTRPCWTTSTTCFFSELPMYSFLCVAVETITSHPTISQFEISFTFRNYEQMKINTEKFFECSHVTSWSLLYSHSSHAHISGLASFWIYRQSKDPIWLERGIEAKEKFKKWYSDTSNSHFESRLYLLEAEESYAKKDIENAKLFYEKAISSAKKNHLVNYEAYGCELAGYFLLENGDTTSIKRISYLMR